MAAQPTFGRFTDFPELKSAIACYNCGTAASDGTWLSEFTLEDGRDVWGCDDCRAEALRIEAEADRLAALPSCPERQRIIDRAQSAAELVNCVTAHDRTGCAACAAVKCDDRGERTPTMFHDSEYNLNFCPACQRANERAAQSPRLPSPRTRELVATLLQRREATRKLLAGVNLFR